MAGYELFKGQHILNETDKTLLETDPPVVSPTNRQDSPIR